MTMIDEISRLRGEPIILKAPVQQVPCNELSDTERLCRNPVVSVHMMAYNHEAYIAQAIEGVVMQRTNFEYELVLGEDASQDRTREICFDYQKRYPDKIRVLWSKENVTRPYGGNETRVSSRCRGEFIAICEGDDYWTDPLKLQKQVDALRANPECMLCFTDAELTDPRGGKALLPWPGGPLYTEGAQGAETFFDDYIHSRLPWIMTATVLVRRTAWQRLSEEEEVFSWRLRLGMADITLVLGVASRWKLFYLKRKTAVYRQGVGLMTRDTRVNVDSKCTRYYYARRKWNHVPEAFIRGIFWARFRRLPWMPRRALCAEYASLRQVPAYSLWTRRMDVRCVGGVLARVPFAAFLLRVALRLRQRVKGFR